MACMYHFWERVSASDAVVVGVQRVVRGRYDVYRTDTVVISSAGRSRLPLHYCGIIAAPPLIVNVFAQKESNL